MKSEFELLAEKLQKLAELSNGLRLENLALRRTAVELAAENKELREKVQTAHARVEAILANLPEEEERDPV